MSRGGTRNMRVLGVASRQVTAAIASTGGASVSMVPAATARAVLGVAGYEVERRAGSELWAGLVFGLLGVVAGAIVGTLMWVGAVERGALAIVPMGFFLIALGRAWAAITLNRAAVALSGREPANG